MKKVCIITGTRAEFGLLYSLIKKVKESKKMKLQLLVTGSHLSSAFGTTKNEIIKKGLKKFVEIKLPLNFVDKKGMAKATSKAIDKFSIYFSINKPDIVVVLGDRYEIFGACIAASMLNIPIAHINGGETTQGAIDEYIRHSITKMSYLHFTSCEEYRKRVIQLGESPNRVFNVGSLSIENIKKLNEYDRNELSKELKLDLNKKYSLVTFHPTTIGNISISNQMNEIVKSLDKYNNMNFIITKSNADAGGKEINKIWDKQAQKHKNWRVVYSLGFEKYLSLMKNCEIVIGNSSSGIIETPIFKKPAINIGDRQKGRLMAKNVICCDVNEKSISKAMNKGLSKSFKNEIRNISNPFGSGHTSEKIVKILEKELAKEINLKKEFFDIK